MIPSTASSVVVPLSALTDRPEDPGRLHPAPTDAVRAYRVALVNMPFVSPLRPSIQIGLLKAIVRRAGFPVDDYYFNVALAARLGLRVYDQLTDPGDMLFAYAAFGEEAAPAEAFASVLAAELHDFDAARLVELRDRTVPAFVEECLNSTDWGAY